MLLMPRLMQMMFSETDLSRLDLRVLEVAARSLRYRCGSCIGVSKARYLRLPVDHNTFGGGVKGSLEVTPSKNVAQTTLGPNSDHLSACPLGCKTRPGGPLAFVSPRQLITASTYLLLTFTLSDEHASAYGQSTGH